MTELTYKRADGVIKLVIKDMTNHELREVLTGLWTRLSSADREDHIAELTHYQRTPESWLSTVARAICDTGENKDWRKKPGAAQVTSITNGGG